MTAVATGVSKPGVPSGFMYQPGSVPAGYGMVNLGRDPQLYSRAAIEAADAAGCLIGIYLNHTCKNGGGKYHQPLHATSIVAPGGKANATGPPALLDDAHLARTEAALRAIRRDFAYVKHLVIFGDDFGASNESFYSTMTASQRAVMTARQRVFAQMYRRVCDELGMRFWVNALWDGRFGQGSPDPNRHGCGEADGQTGEHHADAATPGSFWSNYYVQSQTNLRDRNGRGMHIAIASTMGEAQAIAAACLDVAFLMVQTSAQYGFPGAKAGTFRDLGIPFATLPTVEPEPGAPGTPRVLLFGPDGSGIVQLAWNPALAAGVDSYDLYESGALIDEGITTIQSYAFQGVAGTPYRFRAGAFNLEAVGGGNDGHGPWSDELVVTPPVAPPPPPAGGDCDEVREQLEDALSALTAAGQSRDEALATLASVRGKVAAVGQGIPAALAEALEG